VSGLVTTSHGDDSFISPAALIEDSDDQHLIQEERLEENKTKESKKSPTDHVTSKKSNSVNRRQVEYDNRNRASSNHISPRCAIFLSTAFLNCSVVSRTCSTPTSLCTAIGSAYRCENSQSSSRSDIGGNGRSCEGLSWAYTRTSDLQTHLYRLFQTLEEIL